MPYNAKPIYMKSWSSWQEHFWRFDFNPDAVCQSDATHLDKPLGVLARMFLESAIGEIERT
jgi:hypothetical protein